MVDWQSRKEVIYGNIGEELVDQYLLSKGYVPYLPSKECGAHPFDRLCASRNKQNLFIAEVKTKPARIYFPDTGINIKHFKEYEYIQDKYNLNVLIFFVDQDAHKIYGNSLSKLAEPKRITYKERTIDYPLIDKGIIYFPLVNTIYVADIPSNKIDMLDIYSSRNDAYKEVSR